MAPKRPLVQKPLAFAHVAASAPNSTVPAASPVGSGDAGLVASQAAAATEPEPPNSKRPRKLKGAEPVQPKALSKRALVAQASAQHSYAFEPICAALTGWPE
jgi:hypothetical protein